MGKKGKAGKGRIRPTELGDGLSIRETELRTGHTRFSFKHLDLSHPKFRVGHRETAYFEELLSRLKEYSRFCAAQMRDCRSKAVRCHPIDWSKTTEAAGFTHLNQQLRDLMPWQFQIERRNHGRVHGFFIEDVFYVVWLDPDHRLYS